MKNKRQQKVSFLVESKKQKISKNLKQQQQQMDERRPQSHLGTLNTQSN